jgi:uncharacterized protein YqjF (DUF2071 family)
VCRVCSNGDKEDMTSALDFLETPARQASVVSETAHRPWPLPEEPWVNAQTWERLCFLHWRVDEAGLRALVPRELELQTFDGAAWLGITPFRLSGFRLRGLPPLPLVSAFPELNVRTYVEHGGRPGIFFFSLDAASRPAVEAARRLYRLPYHHARMAAERRDGWVQYDSSRPGRVFSARYRGDGEALHAMPGTLEHFLTERYCLYAHDAEGLWRADVHHLPWLLEAGEAEVELNTMAPLALPAEEPLVHYSERLDVVIWGLDRVAN